MRSVRTTLRILQPILIFAVACEAVRSDAENSSRSAERRRQQQLPRMRAASGSTPRGTPLSGAALVAALEGRTHVFVFGQPSKAVPENFTESFHFAPGGEMSYVNNEWAPVPNRKTDRWRVDAERLCVLVNGYSQVEKCYTIAVDGDGRIQYYIAQPGDEFDGLLTRVTNQILEGPPPGG